MLRPTDILIELERRYLGGDRSMLGADIVRWTAGLPEKEHELYDGIGAELAQGYHQRRYSFEFCDWIVNELYRIMISKQFDELPPPWPKTFWRVYEAFDAGEFHRKPDKGDDSIAEFTDPEITDIVRDLQCPSKVGRIAHRSASRHNGA